MLLYLQFQAKHRCLRLSSLIVPGTIKFGYMIKEPSLGLSFFKSVKWNKYHGVALFKDDLKLFLKPNTKKCYIYIKTICSAKKKYIMSI